MDPNAAVAEVAEATASYFRGDMTEEDYREYRAERYDALREWHARGGFAPRKGWPKDL